MKSVNPQGLIRAVHGLLYLYICYRDGKSSSCQGTGPLSVPKSFWIGESEIEIVRMNVVVVVLVLVVVVVLLA
jgi:hypothetical protein